jgi:hypothetical protein
VDLVGKQTIQTEWPPLVVRLVPTFADRGCRVVSATDLHGRNLGFPDPEALLFYSSNFFYLHSGGCSPNWVYSARRPFIGILYLPRVIVRMKNFVELIGRGNGSTRRKPAPAPLCPPQIPLDQTRARTRAAAVGSQRLTAWAMAQSAVYHRVL